MPFDPLSVGLAGLSAVSSLFNKPDPNKAFRKMMGNPEFSAQYSGADSAYTAAQDWYQTLLSGNPAARRALFAGTMFDMDRAAQGAIGQLQRSPTAQRGGALTLGVSNIQRDLFANKAKAVTGKEQEAAMGLKNVGDSRSQLFSVLGNTWQGAAQADIAAKQMGWNQMFQTGMGIGQALFGKGSGGKGPTWSGLWDKMKGGGGGGAFPKNNAGVPMNLGGFVQFP